MTKDKIIEGLKNESLQFKDLELVYRNDKKYRQNVKELRYASNELKYDKNIVLSVSSNGYALYYASSLLK